jgi:hypothetical protein
MRRRRSAFRVRSCSRGLFAFCAGPAAVAPRSRTRRTLPPHLAVRRALHSAPGARARALRLPARRAAGTAARGKPCNMRPLRSAAMAALAAALLLVRAASRAQPRRALLARRSRARGR